MNELDKLRDEIRVLEGQVEELEDECNRIKDNDKETDEYDHSNDNVNLKDFEELGEFDNLVADLLKTDSISSSKRQKLNDKNNFENIKLKYNDKIQLENCFRLSGLTAFPVNSIDNTGDDKNFLGIRIDIFDTYLKRFNMPHYIILRKKFTKNNSDWNWTIFKTTIPKYIQLQTVANAYLNNDLQKFAVNIRKQLNLLQLKKSTFNELQDTLQLPSKINFDLSVSKVNINVLNKFEIILICNLIKIVEVVVIGDVAKDIKKKLELYLKDSNFIQFNEKLTKILKNCGFSI